MSTKKNTNIEEQQNELAKDETVAENETTFKTVAGQVVTTVSEETPDNKESGEDALEMHYMSFSEKIKYKRAQHKKKMDGMDKKEQFKFFLDYYKWNAIITIFLLVCAGTFAKEMYFNSRPLALGIIIINNTTLADVPEDEAAKLGIMSADDLSAKIEADYRAHYKFHKHDRFNVFTGMHIDLQTYLGEIVSTGTGTLTSYENLFYQTQADAIDIIITDEKGINYCVEQDMVYPIDKLYDEETHALYADKVRMYTSYTGDEREYAIDISGNEYIKSLGLGYKEAYLLFPSNDADNKERAINFYKFLLTYE